MSRAAVVRGECAWCQDDDPDAAWCLIDGAACCGSPDCVAVLSCHECAGTGTEPGSGDAPCGWCRSEDRGRYDDGAREDADEARVDTARDATLPGAD